MVGIDVDKVIMELCDNYPWIRERTDKVFSLFSECESDRQVILTKELLEKFLYIDEKCRNDLYLRMADDIILNYDEDTVISAMSMRHEPDSGAIVVKHLETLLYAKGLHDISDVARLDALTGNKRKRKFSSKTKIIVVDEFCGSGKTIDKRIKFIRENRPDITKIHFCLMAGMGFALDRLKHDYPDVTFYFAEVLNQGILGNYKGENLISNTHAMLQMERCLSETVNRKIIEDYSLGYGNAQALIAFSNFTNIPNSVFPWFWWPLNRKGEKRNQMFIRYENGL